VVITRSIYHELICRIGSHAILTVMDDLFIIKNSTKYNIIIKYMNDLGVTKIK
jgi:hypothetical protein